MVAYSRHVHVSPPPLVFIFHRPAVRRPDPQQDAGQTVDRVLLTVSARRSFGERIVDPFLAAIDTKSHHTAILYW